MSPIPVTEHQIAERSYFLWEGEGKPEGRHLEHWFRAKTEMEAEIQSPEGRTDERTPRKTKQAAGKGKRTSERRKK